MNMRIYKDGQDRIGHTLQRTSVQILRDSFVTEKLGLTNLLEKSHVR
jgi:hypothetical protein